MPNDNNISFRSEEFQDILGKMPGWIIRNGTTLVFLCVVIFLVGSWFFKYPDIISSPMIVTAENPPVNMVARASGQIQNLYVTDNQLVKKGDVLAIIENPGNYHHVLELKRYLDSVRPFFSDFDTAKISTIETDYLLGEVQVDYSNYLKQFNDYRYFIHLNYYPRKITSLNEQVKVVAQNINRVQRQVTAIKNDYQITLRQFKRDSALYKKEVMALADYEKSRSVLLVKKYELEGAQADLSEIQLNRIELEQKVIDAEKELSDMMTSYHLKMNESYNNLLSAIGSWELKYVLTAPVDGTVTFNKYWSETQNVKEGEIVMTVIPDLPSKIVGKVELPIRGSGKVKVGQKVNVKFDNYPYMEYGMVRGKVKNISLVPTNNIYMVELEFPEGLVTNYNVSLELSRELQGKSEIITDELRLIQRIFNPIKSLFKERIID